MFFIHKGMQALLLLHFTELDLFQLVMMIQWSLEASFISTVIDRKAQCYLHSVSAILQMVVSH